MRPRSCSGSTRRRQRPRRSPADARPRPGLVRRARQVATPCSAPRRWLHTDLACPGTGRRGRDVSSLPLADRLLHRRRLAFFGRWWAPPARSCSPRCSSPRSCQRAAHPRIPRQRQLPDPRPVRATSELRQLPARRPPHRRRPARLRRAAPARRQPSLLKCRHRPCKRPQGGPQTREARCEAPRVMSAPTRRQRQTWLRPRAQTRPPVRRAGTRSAAACASGPSRSTQRFVANPRSRWRPLLGRSPSPGVPHSTPGGRPPTPERPNEVSGTQDSGCKWRCSCVFCHSSRPVRANTFAYCMFRR
jgi:hypothetical protein